MSKGFCCTSSQLNMTFVLAVVGGILLLVVGRRRDGCPPVSTLGLFLCNFTRLSHLRFHSPAQIEDPFGFVLSVSFDLLLPFWLLILPTWIQNFDFRMAQQVVNPDEEVVLDCISDFFEWYPLFHCNFFVLPFFLLAIENGSPRHKFCGSFSLFHSLNACWNQPSGCSGRRSRTC